MATRILGISAYYHDSAACLLQDGEIIAAAQEERFTRKKNDASFPLHAIKLCLEKGGLSDLSSIDYVSFYDKPLLKFERLLETYLAYAPRGLSSFLMAMPTWAKDKLFIKHLIRKELAQAYGCRKENLPPVLFSEHHESHAGSAYYPSPFDEAAVLCIDGVGEWATTSAWVGSKERLTPLWELHFPHSLGLLYSAFTYYLGFKVNSGEYKMMGLAPYGESIYEDRILDHLIDVKPDGTFRLNMSYFEYPVGLRMTGRRFAKLFDAPAREPESRLDPFHCNVAASIQKVTERVVLQLVDGLHQDTGQSQLCLAGGVALNCVANGRIQRESKFRNIWVQPAAGDSGGALGSALMAWHGYLGKERLRPERDRMRGALVGSEYTNHQIGLAIAQYECRSQQLATTDLVQKIVELLDQGKVLGLFRGSMEYGPRALGSRSIIADPRSTRMQKALNLKIKFRESFRPFAPIVLADKADQWFELDQESPYMSIVAPIKRDKRLHPDGTGRGQDIQEQLSVKRSSVPAITHVDASARVQTVDGVSNPFLHQVLQAFEDRTGCPILINTSFNVRGEPIVESPDDALRCFFKTEMDALIIGDYLLEKSVASTAEPNLPGQRPQVPASHGDRIEH